MDHIVAIIHPFVMEQEVDVYKDGECIEVIQCKLDNIEEVCYALCKKHEIHQIDLKGKNQLYSLHIKDKLAAAKYDDFDINVTVY